MICTTCGVEHPTWYACSHGDEDRDQTDYESEWLNDTDSGDSYDGEE